MPSSVTCAPTPCFFFSSRRRHTRLQGDWSSDVCSSDLLPRRMHDLRSARRGKDSRERCEIGKGERINAHSVATRRQLHEAEFGAIRTLPEKLGIEAYVLAGLEVRDEINEGGGCRDY